MYSVRWVGLSWPSPALKGFVPECTGCWRCWRSTVDGGPPFTSPVQTPSCLMWSSYFEPSSLRSVCVMLSWITTLQVRCSAPLLLPWLPWHAVFFLVGCPEPPSSSLVLQHLRVSSPARTDSPSQAPADCFFAFGYTLHPVREEGSSLVQWDLRLLSFELDQSLPPQAAHLQSLCTQEKLPLGTWRRYRSSRCVCVYVQFSGCCLWLALLLLHCLASSGLPCALPPDHIRVYPRVRGTTVNEVLSS